MKRANFITTSCILLMILMSCGTAKGSEQETNTQADFLEYEKIIILDENSKTSDFPFLSYNPPPDRLFRSAFIGKVDDDSFRQKELNIFDGRLIIEMETDYVLYKENKQIKYYLMIFDFNKSVSDGIPVSPGDVLGQVGDKKAKLLVFSETLDPYLVISSGSYPVFFAGYFWFDPSFLTPNGAAKWLAFDPVDNVDNEIMEIASHVKNETPGLAIYDKRIRFSTKLSQYPREMSDDEKKSIQSYERILYGRNGIVADVTEVNAEGCNYLLCWQNGFLEHLKKEYVLNDEIWLYGVILTYDVWKERGYIFLRDFTPVSLEEMYEGRLRILKGN